MESTASSGPAHSDATGLERLIFFSDAVFAIAITMLALEIRLPPGEYADSAALLAGLLSLWPKYLSYAISFLVIGGYWIAHHRNFRLIVRYDRTLLFLNLLLLLGIGFVPFPTAVLGDYSDPVATMFYAATMATVGVLSALVWWYASYRGRLLRQPLSRKALQLTWVRALTAPAIFLLSIPLATLNDDLARGFWISIALAIVVEGRSEVFVTAGDSASPGDQHDNAIQWALDRPGRRQHPD